MHKIFLCAIIFTSEVFMEKNISSCAFTGHRPKSFSFGYDESSAEFEELKIKIRNTITQVCNAGCRTFYCGMAEGADLWCGEIVLEIKDKFDPPLEICTVAPFLMQASGMTEKNKIRYRKIMDHAKKRFLVSRGFTNKCYQKRNYFMVDSCDALIAVYNENESKSGTGQTIRYAKKKNKKIFFIHI